LDCVDDGNGSVSFKEQPSLARNKKISKLKFSQNFLSVQESRKAPNAEEVLAPDRPPGPVVTTASIPVTDLV
jgi:hypothetical protein